MAKVIRTAWFKQFREKNLNWKKPDIDRDKPRPYFKCSCLLSEFHPTIEAPKWQMLIPASPGMKQDSSSASAIGWGAKIFWPPKTLVGSAVYSIPEGDIILVFYGLFCRFEEFCLPPAAGGVQGDVAPEFF
jgi:hypothetical protein